MIIITAKKRTQYNWPKYNKELVNRGKRLANQIKTIKTEVVEFWGKELELMNNGKEGARFMYPNSQIIFFMILRSAFSIYSYRRLEGLGILFFDQVPDYTRLNRRIRQLDTDIIKKINREVTKASTNNRIIEISMDGTGVQINGKYVWTDKKTKKLRKGDWKKINISIDIETRKILGIKVLNRSQNEGSHENTVSLMDETSRNISSNSKINRAYADAGYDSISNFEFLNELGIQPVIKTKKKSRQIAASMNNTDIREHKRKKYFSKARNREALKQYYWKYYVEEYEYGKRSTIEGVIGSFKRFFREKLFSRTDDMVEKEILTRVLVWNMIV